MTRGRKPDRPAAPVVGELVEPDTQAIAELARATESVIVEFGDGLPWSLDHYEAEIHGELRRGCESFLRAGRLLVVARQCASHGEWAGMLERLGVEHSQAKRMMQAARRISALPNGATSHHLLAAAKSQGKLIELLSLPEDQFAELADTGATQGLDLDDVADMSVRELRAAVREAREQMAAKDEVSGTKERKIERLTAELAKAKRQRAKATPDETTAELREKASLAAFQVRIDLTAHGEGVESVFERFAELRQHAEAQGDYNQFDDFMGGLLGELLGEIRKIRDHYSLPLINDGDFAPWMKDV